MMDRLNRMTRMTRRPFPTKRDILNIIPARIEKVGSLILLDRLD